MIIQHTNFGCQSIVRCGIHDGCYDFGSHIHQYSELVMVLSGELEMTVDGRVEVSRAGDVTVIPPFVAHSFHTPDYCKIWICVFSNDFILGFLTNEELNTVWSRATFTMSDTLVRYLEGNRFVETCLAFDWSDECCRTVRASLSAIYEEYLRGVTRRERGAKENAITAVLLYISEHFRENISLSSVGEAIGYTPWYISHCLASIPNMNFCTLVNSLRVEYAKNLLITTDFKNIDIALESGFSNERSFFRAFLALVGKTPGEYRRAKRRNLPKPEERKNDKTR